MGSSSVVESDGSVCVVGRSVARSCSLLKSAAGPHDTFQTIAVIFVRSFPSLGNDRANARRPIGRVKGVCGAGDVTTAAVVSLQ